jgi:hypothetical protein
MKLPGRRRITGFTPIPQQPLSTGGSEGAAIASALSGVAKSVEKDAATIYQIDQEAAYNDFNLKVEQGLASWDSENLPKEEYGINEIDYRVKQRLGITEEQYPDGIVPAHVVQAEARRSFYQDLVQRNSRMISSSRVRDKAVKSHLIREAQTYSKMVESSSRRAKTYHKKKTLGQYEQKITERDYAGAIAVIENSPIKDKALSQKLIREAGSSWQTEELGYKVNSTDIGELTSLLDGIDNSDPNLVGYLSPEQAISWRGRVERQISDVLKGRDAENKGQKKLLKKNGQLAAESRRNGIRWNQEEYQQLYAQNLAEGNVLVAQEMLLAEAAFHARESLDRQSAPATRDLIKQINETKFKDPIKASIAEDLKKAALKNLEEQSTDFIQWAQDHHVYPDMPPMDYENIFGTIKGRLPYIQHGLDHFGTFTGAFSDEEARRVAGEFHKSSRQEKMETYAGIAAAVDGDEEMAHLIWEQLGMEPEARVGAVAGPMVVEGNIRAAEIVTAGNEIRKSERNPIRKAEKDVREQIGMRVGNIYRENVQATENIVNGVLDAIAYMVVQDKGSYSEAGDITEIDSKIIESAYQMVVGPSGEINGYETPLPGRSWTPEKMRARMRDIPAYYFEDTPLAPEEVKERLDDGSMHLIAKGKNQYYLAEMSGLQRYVLKKNDGAPFILSFTDDLPSIRLDNSIKNAEFAAREIMKGGKHVPQSIWDSEGKQFFETGGEKIGELVDKLKQHLEENKRKASLAP